MSFNFFIIDGFPLKAVMLWWGGGAGGWREIIWQKRDLLDCEGDTDWEMPLNSNQWFSTSRAFRSVKIDRNCWIIDLNHDSNVGKMMFTILMFSCHISWVQWSVKIECYCVGWAGQQWSQRGTLTQLWWQWSSPDQWPVLLQHNHHSDQICSTSQQLTLDIWLSTAQLWVRFVT